MLNKELPARVSATSPGELGRLFKDPAGRRWCLTTRRTVVERAKIPGRRRDSNGKRGMTVRRRTGVDLGAVFFGRTAPAFGRGENGGRGGPSGRAAAGGG